LEESAKNTAEAAQQRLVEEIIEDLQQENVEAGPIGEN